MSKEQNLEFKVGVFVLAAFILLISFIFSISDFSLFKQGKTLKVFFGFANGLKRSAPVRLAGVDAGTVKDIKVFFDPQESKTKVEVGVWVDEQTQIPADSRVWINQLGLLGEKYVEIIPGTNTTHLLENNATIIGEDPVAMEQISEMINKIAKKLEYSVDGFNTIVNNQENQKSIADTLKNVSLITSNIKEGKGTVGRLFYDESVFNNLDSFTADIKENPWKLLYRPKPKR